MNDSKSFSVYPDRIFDYMLPWLLSFEMNLSVKQWSIEKNSRKNVDAFLMLIEEMWRRIALREPTDVELFKQYYSTVGILLNTVWSNGLLDNYSRETIDFLIWAVGDKGIRITIRSTLEKNMGRKTFSFGDFTLDSAINNIAHSLGNHLRYLH